MFILNNMKTATKINKKIKRERERERERDRERERNRDRDRQTDRQTETELERQRDRDALHANLLCCGQGVGLVSDTRFTPTSCVAGKGWGL